MTEDKSRDKPETDSQSLQSNATTEYCAKLQQWMWQYYWGYASWQSCLALTTLPFPPPCSFPPTTDQTPAAPASTSVNGQHVFDTRNWYNYPYPFTFPASFPHLGGDQTEQSSATTPLLAPDARPAQQQNPPRAGEAQIDTVAYFIENCKMSPCVRFIMYKLGHECGGKQA